MDIAKILDVHYIPFNNFFTIDVMFVSNGLICAFRSAEMNLIVKQNILHQNLVKSDLDRKSHLFLIIIRIGIKLSKQRTKKALTRLRECTG